ncbi:Yip1 domain-containing protein [Rhodovulum sp. ES.010]|uniref:YIP1 family protein n=1 Tax=Rhodovulum sp. ES.010 TaxID=1882821 RepID=UPI00092A8506|nr:YIP1 family protein [Rhodovulum sp. ES.010]SIO16319.1 Yip1 domain-containing protein [Rhodovulum sp. ES.010]
MALTQELLATWRGPREAMRRRLQAGKREDRALAYLMLACFLIFMAQWPRLAREAYLIPEVPLEARLGAALFGWMALAPLFFYGIAAFSHLFAQMLGGRGSFYGARLALFWALLATAPAVLAYGLAAGFVGAGVVLNLLGSALVVAFFAIWLLCLKEAEAPVHA